VQAAISDDPLPITAVLAWVLGVPFQGRGYARESAAVLVEWLVAVGVGRLVAYIHPENAASMGVARGLGLSPTTERVNGEIVWEQITASA
jgi:RimJ/RimL family protein N-acetyltransferase